MKLDDLIEQLEQTRKDHAFVGNLDVRVNDLDVFMVHLVQDENRFYIELECCRPYALTEQANPNN